jgi:hypothetical protein
MAVTAQEQIAPEAPEPAKPARRRAVAWPKPSQLQQSVPVIRLLAEIWSIPQVSKIGILNDDEGVQVRVLVGDDRESRAKVFEAERTYLNTTPPHPFRLRVTSVAKTGDQMPVPFDLVLER